MFNTTVRFLPIVQRPKSSTRTQPTSC
jgi:hypothetical protein